MRASGKSQVKWSRWSKLMHRRNPAVGASLTVFPTCGEETLLVDKTTMTGRDMRTRRGERCGKEHVVNFGPAPWQVLHDARESDRDTS